MIRSKEANLFAEFSTEAERQKRLGQYFTGTSLGRILAALAKVDEVGSAIDPMAGSGDLLVASTELSTSLLDIAALDIDPMALRACKQRLPGANCFEGSAFDPRILAKLQRKEWDLVIANPPYVRYQSLTKGSRKDLHLPNAVEIRNGLLSEIEMLSSLDEADKQLFGRMASGYSGLADLAVPSWILCAGLVALGGRLAIVVPESWLSRDYAAVVHYLLLRWFEIEFVVEDEHAAWFPNAQVKTTLIVAKRVHRKKSAFNLSANSSFLKIVVSGSASGPGGACSRIRSEKNHPELSFAKDARNWLSKKVGHSEELIRAFHIPMTSLASNLKSSCVTQKWFPFMGEENQEFGPVIPHELRKWQSRSSTPGLLTTISSIGINVGQGLRTGANPFFYGELINPKTLAFQKLFPSTFYRHNSKICLPVIRGQQDLPAGFTISSEHTKGRVLDFRKYALSEDVKKVEKLFGHVYKELPLELSNFVRSAGKANFGDKNNIKRIWELSAVAPNNRKGVLSKGIPPRYWYMLPDFTRRHRPNIVVARINSGSPKAFLNKNAKCVIDANFATLWVDGADFDEYALLAMLNSAWITSALEYSATIMGGGALKIEAAHIKRLPIPVMNHDAIAKLSLLGVKLSEASQEAEITRIFKRIDIVVASAALGKKASAEDISSLRVLSEYGKKKRQNHIHKRSSK